MQSVCSIMLSLNISLLSFLPDRNFTGAHCAIVPWCPPPLGSAPLTGPHCSPQLFISTFLISHARISEQSAILINVSCFSALPVQGITHTRGPWEVWYEWEGGWGSYWHSNKWSHSWQTVSVSSKRLLLPSS